MANTMLYWKRRRCKQHGDMTDSEEKEIQNSAPSESAQLDALRYERNMLLQETDWTQNRDVTLSNDADWKKYRQDFVI